MIFHKNEGIVLATALMISLVPMTTFADGSTTDSVVVGEAPGDAGPIAVIDEARNWNEAPGEGVAKVTKEIMPISLRSSSSTTSKTVTSVEHIVPTQGDSMIEKVKEVSGEVTQTNIEPLIVNSGDTAQSDNGVYQDGMAVSVMSFGTTEIEQSAGVKMMNALSVSYTDASATVGPDTASDEVTVVSLNSVDTPIVQDDIVMDPYEVIADESLMEEAIYDGKVLVNCVSPDPNYRGQALNLTGENRENFYRLVMGEAGDEGYEGAALVAQALRDTMVMVGDTNTLSIKSRFKYSGRLKTPNQTVRDAVDYILNGGSAVQHRVIYFYAPRICNSGFHESQNFVIEWGGHRFFDKV